MRQDPRSETTRSVAVGVPCPHVWRFIEWRWKDTEKENDTGGGPEEYLFHCQFCLEFKKVPYPE